MLRVVQVVRQQRCNGHCLCDSAQAQHLKQQLRSAQVAGQWRGDTALTLPLFWRRSTLSPVFFGRCPRSSIHSFVRFPPPSPSSTPVPVPNKQPRFCGRKAIIMVYETTQRFEILSRETDRECNGSFVCLWFCFARTLYRHCENMEFACERSGVVVCLSRGEFFTRCHHPYSSQP